MADYTIAINKVLVFEGGYVNDPSDSGGETYKGIARKFWPNWEGWKIIDSYKSKSNFPKSLYSDKNLTNLVILFYKANFWDKIKGDSIKNQEFGDILVDSAVNEGVSPAIKRAEMTVSLPQTGKISDELIKRLNTLQ